MKIQNKLTSYITFPKDELPCFKKDILNGYNKVIADCIKDFMELYGFTTADINKFTISQHPKHEDILFDGKVFGTVKTTHGYHRNDFIENKITVMTAFTPNPEYK